MDEKKIDKKNDKIAMFSDYDTLLQRAIDDRKRELEDLQHKILLANSNLSRLQDSLAREQGNFEQWKRSETNKLEQEKVRRLALLSARENQLSNGESYYAKRKAELEQREVKILALEQERNKIALERIEVEKLMLRANEMAKAATLKSESASATEARAATREAAIKTLNEQIKSKEADLILRENRINEKISIEEKQLKNLEEVRKAIEPRIEELKALEANIKKQSIDLENQKKDLANVVAEERNLLIECDSRKKTLKEAEAAFTREKVEWQRQKLLGEKK